jgi:ribosome biogenesis GTPase
MDLKNLGYDIFFQTQFNKLNNNNLKPARIANEQKGRYRIISQDGEFYAEISGKFQYNTKLKVDYPAVGDWVAIEAQEDNFAIIHHLLPRKSFFTRNIASYNKRFSGGVTESQVLASNIDTVFIVIALDNNFSVRRVERYLTQVWDSGARAVIILNKEDLCDDKEEKILQIKSIAGQTQVISISAINDSNLSDTLHKYFKEGETIVLLGSSGVGKSTIINKVLGYNKQKTHDLSNVIKKGMHTTTSRELIILEKGGILMDTPGTKELQLWADEESVSNNFEDIEKIAANCKFNNCQHNTEPDCAIQEALLNNELDIKRFTSYLDIKKEVELLKTRKVESPHQQRKEKRKSLSKHIKQMKKAKIYLK